MFDKLDIKLPQLSSGVNQIHDPLIQSDFNISSGKIYDSVETPLKFGPLFRLSTNEVYSSFWITKGKCKKWKTNENE